MPRPRVSLTGWIVLAMALGVTLGGVLGPRAAAFAGVGKLLVGAIKVFATPLLFFAILHAVVTTEVNGRLALRMVGIATINATLALLLGLLLANTFPVGAHLAPLFADSSAPPVAPPALPELSVTAFVGNFVPSSIVSPFAENLAIGVIVLALLLGLAWRTLGRDPQYASLQRATMAFATIGLRTTELILTWVVSIVPFAVFAAVASAVGTSGLASLVSLGYYVALGVGGLTLHVLFVYHAWLWYLRVPVRVFWRHAKRPVVYALGANSSLATLPLTLQALDELSVPRDASTLGACVGTNINNDGILLYEALAAILVAQALGLAPPLSEQLLIAVIAMIAAMGIAGVPEAGFISLALVLATVGLPVEALPILLSVDWIIARGRSVVNVLSDMIVSLGIAGRRPERENAPWPGSLPEQSNGGPG